jgi:TPR repeat protein
MSRLLRAAFAILFVAILFPAPSYAKDKPPTGYDKSRESFVYDGRQNYPYIIRGVMIDWELACLKGKAESCLKLARAFEQGFGVIYADQRAAVGYFMEACKKGSGEGCVRAAEMLREGTPGYKLPAMSQQQVDRGCNQLKYQPACASLAVSQAAAAPSGSDQSDALLAKACAGGDDTGCRNRANSLFYGRKDAASRTEALKLYEPACQSRKSWGCMGMADAYRNGWGVAADKTRASEFERIGCVDTSGDKLRLCTYHGERLTDSTTKADLNRGEQYLSASCSANDGQACFYVSRLFLLGKSGATTTFQESMYFARRGCELGEGRACLLLGLIYTGEYGQVEAEQPVAFALFERGCSLGEQASCSRVTKMAAANPGLKSGRPAINPAAPAVQQLQQSRTMVESGNGRQDGLAAAARLMHEGNEDAAWLLGGWMYNGLPGLFGTERRKDGLILFENAARVGHVEAAIFMGMAYWYGGDVPVDQNKGMNYMAIAASRGDRKADAILRSMKNEPIRQENARRQAQYAEWERRSREFWNSPASMFSRSWTAPSSSYNPTPTYGGPSVSQIYDTHNFNNAIKYYSGGTSSCSSSNPYC